MRILHLRIPCRDLDRSMAFYEALGFVRAEPRAGRRSNPTEPVSDPDVANVLGIPAETTFRSGDLHLKGFTPGTHLQLLELRDLPDRAEATQPSTRLPLFAVSTSRGLEDAIATVKRMGGEVPSDPVVIPSLNNVRVVVVRDPDGTVLELIEPRADILNLRREAEKFRSEESPQVVRVEAARALGAKLPASRQAAAMENW